jgi:hypothetical protein
MLYMSQHSGKVCQLQCVGGRASSHACSATQQLQTPLVRHTAQPQQYAATALAQQERSGLHSPKVVRLCCHCHR